MNKNKGGFSLTDLYHALKGQRDNFKPKMRKLLSVYGDEKISQIQICRRPISSVLNTIINFFSINKSHDKYFHLFYIFTLNNVHLILEKNQELNMDIYKPSNIDEIINIPLVDTTINTLLNNAIKEFGKNRILVYNAVSNNCQRFVMDIAIANNFFINADTALFILQNTKNLLPEWADKLTYTITNLANRANILIEGYGIKTLTNKQIKNILQINY